MSLLPDAVSVIDATFFQADEPPVTAGEPGAVRSMRASATIQADVRPTPSIARKPTWVAPWLLTGSEEPLPTLLQVAPPSVEVRY